MCRHGVLKKLSSSKKMLQKHHFWIWISYAFSAVHSGGQRAWFLYRQSFTITLLTQINL